MKMFIRLAAGLLVVLGFASAQGAVIVIQPDGTVGKDAAVNSEPAVANLNNGTSGDLTAFYTVVSEVQGGLIQFDLSPYAGQSVASASLTLFATNNTNLPNQVYFLHANLAAWNEATVTFANAPAFGAAIASLAISPGQYFSFDVTSVVNQWLAGSLPNYGLRLTENNGAVFFSSSDAALAERRPALSLDLTTPPVPEPGSLALLALGLAGLGWVRRAAAR